MVLAVRLHAGNPWVAERLAALRQHYRELPSTLVVDFGSSEPYGAQLAALCAEHGLRYLREEDAGTYSAARARNLGARAARTPLLFFCDVDCFGEADLFERLIAHANRIDMASYLEQVVNLPAYSLGAQETREIWSAPAPVRGELLARRMLRKTYDAFDPAAYSYVDPASNFFMIRRDFFELVGGYDESFRGHGSEDFEFFLRLAHYTEQFPLPAELERDLYSPTNPAFFEQKLYRGFRRYMELMAFQAECAGLRIAHLHHAREADRWYAEKDRGRLRFRARVASYHKQPSRLIERDFLPRAKRALVLLKHERQTQYFLPLRLLGYQLHLMLSGDAVSEQRAREMLEGREVDAVAVFNPYMGSHRELLPWVERARALDVPLLVTDRGMLPESWFFAEDMPYGDGQYRALDPASWSFDEEELQIARDYAAVLRQGGATLEHNGDFADTMRRRERGRGARLTLLIPLQLDDDVAVTCFNEGHPSYAQFVADITVLARANPDVRFLVKTHPLSKRPFEGDTENLEVCDSQDNIHALIELSDALVCYNSGVGFLGLVHHKPVLTVGNAFYNIPGTGQRVESLTAALDSLRAERRPPDAELMNRYLAWHLFRKYAFFKATSEVQELRTRRAHHYRNLLPYQLPGSALMALRVSADHPFGERSYAAGKLVVSARTSTRQVRLRNDGASLLRKLRKLARDPRRFARDSRLARKILG